MKIGEKCAYIKGLMEGLEMDTTTKEGKVISAIVDALADICQEVEQLNSDMETANDEIETLNDDLDDLYDDLYEDDGDEEDEPESDEEGEELAGEYEISCPKCGEVTVVDEETLFNDNAEIKCAHCGAAFDIEFGSDEKDNG